jgi:hypothetical protein
MFPMDEKDATWLDSGHDQPGTVGFHIPPGFPAYARVLHPVYYYDDEHRDFQVDVTWKTIAAANGITLSRTSSFKSISPGESYMPGESAEHDYGGPIENELPDAQMRTLIRILEVRTRTPDDCTFLWVNGVDSGLPDNVGYRINRAAGPCRVVTGRACSDALIGLPSVWWPLDHSWIVVTQVDMNSTLVGCAREVLSELVAEESLEVFEVSRDDLLERD